MTKCPKCGSGDIEQIRAGETDDGAFTLDVTAEQFESLFENKIDSRDFIGLGNMILEGLMRPNQHKKPDDISRHIAEEIDEIIAAKFNIHESLSYGRPHADWHMPPHLRRQWEADTFPQLCIFAYVLGATWKVLPLPHSGLIDYFHLMAEKQEHSILDAREKTAPQARRYDPTNF